MDEKLKALLAPFPSVEKLKVQWSDMDMAHHVNNVIYLRWAEIGRVGYFEKLDLGDFRGGELAAVVAKLEAKYRFPVKYPDHVYIGTRATRLEGNRLTLETCIYSELKPDVACKVVAELVMFNAVLGQKTDMPEQVAYDIFRLEGWI